MPPRIDLRGLAELRRMGSACAVFSETESLNPLSTRIQRLAVYFFEERLAFRALIYKDAEVLISGPRSSGDRALASGARRGGSIPPGGKKTIRGLDYMF